MTNHTHHWWIPQNSHLYWARKQKKGCSYTEKEKLYECITEISNPFRIEPTLPKFWEKEGINRGTIPQILEGLKRSLLVMWENGIHRVAEKLGWKLLGVL